MGNEDANIAVGALNNNLFVDVATTKFDCTAFVNKTLILTKEEITWSFVAQQESILKSHPNFINSKLVGSELIRFDCILGYW